MPLTRIELRINYSVLKHWGLSAYLGRLFGFSLIVPDKSEIAIKQSLFLFPSFHIIVNPYSQVGRGKCFYFCRCFRLSFIFERIWLYTINDEFVF